MNEPRRFESSDTVPIPIEQIRALCAQAKLDSMGHTCGCGKLTPRCIRCFPPPSDPPPPEAT